MELNSSSWRLSSLLCNNSDLSRACRNDATSVPTSRTCRFLHALQITPVGCIMLVLSITGYVQKQARVQSVGLIGHGTRQVVNLVSNRVARILGKVENSERFLRLALYQGVPSSGTTKSKRLGAGVKVHEADPTLVACAHNRPRLFLFTRREPADTDEAATGRCGQKLRVAGCSDRAVYAKFDSLYWACKDGVSLGFLHAGSSTLQTWWAGGLKFSATVAREKGSILHHKKGSPSQLAQILQGWDQAAHDAFRRDVFNEKPSLEEVGPVDGAAGGDDAAEVLPRGAVVHTTKGDITLKLFPDECPKTVENFTTHARNGYYEGIIFHRVIKGFMLQTGDPLGVLLPSLTHFTSVRLSRAQHGCC